MAVKIITDSTSDMPQEMAKKLGVVLAPLTVSFEGVEYIDGVNLSKKEFYEKLIACKELPTSSQVSVGVFIDIFEKAIKDGDEVVAILVSSELSGTYQSANIARETMGSDKIHIIDTHTVTAALASLVVEAAAMRDQGQSALEIFNNVKALKAKSKIFGVIDNLKYLKKGGRMPASLATIGTLLKLKPIVTEKGGKLDVIDKARGKKAGLNYLKEKIDNGNIDLEKGIYFAHAHSLDEVNTFIETLDLAKNQTKTIIEIGIAVGTHAGPGTIAVCYFEK